ncbi:MAG: orotate phosphoribosyltransferase [Sulfobacillus acidophilus]|uniref:Orotate phosphoribosyltransferase n=1 Tax=Sulfobacillus acidophilus TaxID=53633 RepID=A0A2T2WFH0_9FIRM|nr:MAG: orotate phosphoribosyltransferase [Sulfobacillus acidophilus]
MTQTFESDRAWTLLRQARAYLTGHFALTTGRHSDQFFLLARLTERPDWLYPWAKELAGRLTPYRPAIVVGPAMGGIIPAFAVAAQWPGTRMLFAEKEGGAMRFKRGFQIEPGEPVIVVEDAVTTGGSVAQVIEAVEGLGGQVRAVGALVDRSQGSLAFSAPFEAVLRAPNIPAWEPHECPLCRQGVPLTRPKQ